MIGEIPKLSLPNSLRGPSLQERAGNLVRKLRLRMGSWASGLSEDLSKVESLIRGRSQTSSQYDSAPPVPDFFELTKPVGKETSAPHLRVIEGERKDERPDLKVLK
jgi:hypothetical protein